MELDCYVRGIRAGDVAAHARSMEDIGFTRVWTSEGAHEPFAPVAAAAAATSTIRFGTNAAVAFARSPMITAHITHDLQLMTDGRMVLGLGSQVKAHIERRFAMTWRPAASAMREYVECVRSIWHGWQTGGPAVYQGEHYSITLHGPNFDPGPSAHASPPILVGATGPMMLRVAAEVGDGLLCHPLATPTYLRDVVLPALHGSRGAGEIVVSPLVAVPDEAQDERAARADVRLKLGFYCSTAAYRPMLESEGLGELYERCAALARAQRWRDLADTIDDDTFDRLAVSGSPATVGATLAERFGGLATHVAPIQLDDGGRPRRDLGGLAEAGAAREMRAAFLSRCGPADAPRSS